MRQHGDVNKRLFGNSSPHLRSASRRFSKDVSLGVKFSLNVGAENSLGRVDEPAQGGFPRGG